METTTRTVRAIAYTRVSTGRQAESGLGLADQIDGIRAAAERKGWALVHHAEDAGLSGRSMRARPALVEALSMLDKGDADVLVASKLDRLTRSMLHFAQLVDRAERKGWALVVLDVDVDTSTPVGKLTANVLASVAQFERERIAERTKAAHRVRRERGKRAGQAPVLPAAVRARVAAERGSGASLRAIAEGLNTDEVPTAKAGAVWHASTVAHVLRSVALDADLGAVRLHVAAPTSLRR